MSFSYPSSSNRQATPNSESNAATVLHQFANPLYTEADHSYSSADVSQTPVHYYSTPHVHSSGVQQARDTDNRHSEQEPVYTIISEEEVRRARGNHHHQVPITSNGGQGQPVQIDDYCEPADSTVKRQPPLYHVLDSGPPNTNGSSVFGSPPPLYHVLEESPAVSKAPISAWYEEARVFSGCDQPHPAPSAPPLPVYGNIGGQDTHTLP